MPHPGITILAYRLGSLGDICVSIPALRALRMQFPEARIVLLTNEPVADIAASADSVVEGCGLIDDVIAYPVGTRSATRLFRLFLNLRSIRPDMVVNLTAWRGAGPLLRDWGFFRLAGIKRLIGFNTNTCRTLVRLSDGSVESESVRLLRRLAGLCVPRPLGESSFAIEVGLDEKQWARRLLNAHTIEKPFIAISLGTKVQANDWGLENWRNLVARLSIRLEGFNCIFLGAKQEFEKTELCREKWENGAVNLCGLTTPRQSAALLSLAAIYFGHDSGPMHLAAAVRTPCVAIFGARNPRGQWFPLGGPHRVLYRQTDCAECGLAVCIKEGKKCLSLISVDDVVQAAVDLLGATRTKVH